MEGFIPLLLLTQRSQLHECFVLYRTLQNPHMVAIRRRKPCVGGNLYSTRGIDSP